MNTSLPTTQKRLLNGVVTSAKMQATVVVRVDRRVAHEKYGKYFTISKKFKVHNPDGKAKLGDTIEFEECRPLSRDKRWRYVATVKTAV